MGDLRFILTTLRLLSELERSGDLMVNVCKASRRIYDIEFGPQLRGLIEHMGEEAFLVRTAIDSYVDADTSLAAALDDIDDRLDELQTAFVQAIFLLLGGQPPELAGRGAARHDLGRYYERIGDHAVNIGNRVEYMVTGWLPDHPGATRPAAPITPSPGSDGDALGPGTDSGPDSGPAPGEAS